MHDPSDVAIPIVPAGQHEPPWRRHARRFGPYVATGVATLLLGIFLGAAIFSGDDEGPAAAAPCKEESPEPVIEATATPAAEPAPPPKRKTSSTRPRSESSSQGGGGGHF